MLLEILSLYIIHCHGDYDEQLKGRRQACKLKGYEKVMKCKCVNAEKL